MLARKYELILAVVCLAFALIAVLVWIPQDTETGMIEKFRRQTSMGDAFVPILAGVLMAICAAIQFVISFFRTDKIDTEVAPIDGTTVAFMLQLSVITILSLALMYWAGPIAVELFAQPDEGTVTYRQMRSNYPYKLIGFVLGGFCLVFLISSMIEGKFLPSRILMGVISVAILIAVFDLPLDTVLLPPNGDW